VARIEQTDEHLRSLTQSLIAIAGEAPAPTHDGSVDVVFCETSENLVFQSVRRELVFAGAPDSDPDRHGAVIDYGSAVAPQNEMDERPSEVDIFARGYLSEIGDIR
jgi:hypothetical protein